MLNMLTQAKSFLSGTPYGPVIVVLGGLLLVVLVVLPLIRKARRKSIKNRETKDIMKDLLTWRHLARLVKGGDEHSKAKQELSDAIVRINELLKQGFLTAAKNIQNIYAVPWYAVLGEPRSGKSALLGASDMELVPSAEENNPGEDPQKSLPLRMWTGAKAIIYDISGKVFFDRWLEASGAEWSYIVRQICRRKRRGPLDGIILTIPADALLADDDNLCSKKAILMATELGKLLRLSGMILPCYVAVTKLDMVSGFQEYAKVFSGDLRHQILGFESDSSQFDPEAFKKFWEKLYERLRSGAKQLIFSEFNAGEKAVNRMDLTGKIWFFPDNFAALQKNLRIYLDILFGENNFHGTKNTFFEGVYFTSAKDLGFSFSPDIAALAGRSTDDVLIPVFRPSLVESSSGKNEFQADSVASTALMVVNSTRALIAPYIQRANLERGYFIRDLLNRRIFVPSPHTGFVRKEALRRNIPYFALCGLMISLGLFWLVGGIVNTGKLRVSLIQAESYYEWLDSALRKGSHFRSPLIKEDDQRFVLDNTPLAGETFSSRLQFYYNALNYRDLKISPPASFKCSEILVFRFDRNMGYREKAFIANQLHKSMVRAPIIENVGRRLLEQIDSQALDTDSRELIVSFVSLDNIQGVDFYKFFSSSRFRLEIMIRYLMPEISRDTMGLLNNYRPRYDRADTFQMDVDYIYSEDYRRAKEAAIETVISAWRRRDVYPDSIYGKLKTLAAISGEITVNFADITDALNRISSVAVFPAVEGAVYEWRRLTDRHKQLASQGRALFEELRALMRAAHIPLGFETALPAINTGGAKGGGIAGILKRPVLDAFGNNLINDYLFNDLVINYAVREYTGLFDADIGFVKGETGNGGGLLGQIISEQNTFSADLHREVENLRRQALVLRDDAFLSQKLDEKPDSPSLFMVVERILNLASDIPMPRRETIQTLKFENSWQRGQSSIKTVLDAFEVFVKPYLENEKISILIANARVMLQAEAYYNRYIIFTTSLSFLNTFVGNIAGVIESRSENPDLFSFSGSAIQNLFGGFYYNRAYDPQQLKTITDDISSFTALFKTGEEAKNQPLFLQNVDKRLYQPQAFMEYLESYISYWGNYPENVYVSAGSWERFKVRASEYKSFQINSVLLSIYAKSLEALTQIDNSLLSEYLLALRSRHSSSLGDKLSLLNQFLSVPAERMFSAWTGLPGDPLEAYAVLRAATEEDLKNTYLAVYAGPESLSIGWWNSFVLDGVTLLSRHSDQVNMTALLNNMSRYKGFPLCVDAPPPDSLSFGAVKEIASLLDVLGAGIPEQSDGDPFKFALRHSLFRSSRLQNWAGTIRRIAGIIAGAEKPLSWTINQPPVDTQNRLPNGERLLAINRFRYVEVSTENNNRRMSSTYISEKQTLLQGNPEEAALTFSFYKTSRDGSPGAVITFSKPWSIFELYLRGGRVADDKGSAYIPLYIADEAGQYVYYIEIEFNAEMPGPASWYSSRNWPEIMIADGMITERP